MAVEKIAEADLAATASSKILDIPKLPAVVAVDLSGPKGQEFPPMLIQRMKNTAGAVLRDAQKQYADYVKRAEKGLLQIQEEHKKELTKLFDTKPDQKKFKAEAAKITAATEKKIEAAVKSFNDNCKKAVELEVANAEKFAKQEVEFMAKTDKEVKKWKVKMAKKVVWKSFLATAKFVAAIGALAASIAATVATVGAAGVSIPAAAGAAFGAVVSAGKDIKEIVDAVLVTFKALDDREREILQLMSDTEKEQLLDEKKTKGKMEKLKNLKNKLSGGVTAKVGQLEKMLKDYDVRIMRLEKDAMKLSKKVSGTLDVAVKAKEMVKGHKELLQKTIQTADKIGQVKAQVEMLSVSIDEARKWRNNMSVQIKNFKEKQTKFTKTTSKVNDAIAKVQKYAPIIIDFGKTAKDIVSDIAKI